MNKVTRILTMVGMGLLAGAEFFSHQSVDRQKDGAALLLGRRLDGAGLIQHLALDQGLAHLPAARGQDGQGRAARM